MKVNLMRGHGGPTSYHYLKGCRCIPCVVENRQRTRRWELDNPEKACEKHARNFAASRDQILERRRARYEINYETYAEQLRERARNYYRANIAKERLRIRVKSARRRSSKGTFTAADVRAQHDRQRGRCYYCAKKLGKTYHVDHVTPLILGGSNDPGNLVISCPFCNLSKGAKHPIEYAGRLC